MADADDVRRLALALPHVVEIDSDGFDGLKGQVPPSTRRAVVLMDPSYEGHGDYSKVIASLREAILRFPEGTIPAGEFIIGDVHVRAIEIGIVGMAVVTLLVSLAGLWFSHELRDTTKRVKETTVSIQTSQGIAASGNTHPANLLRDTVST